MPLAPATRDTYFDTMIRLLPDVPLVHPLRDLSPKKLVVLAPFVDPGSILVQEDSPQGVVPGLPPCGNGLLWSCLKAWSLHCPLALSPISLWLAVCQGIGKAIQLDPGRYAGSLLLPEFVDTFEMQGRVKLTILRSHEEQARGLAGDRGFWRTQLPAFEALLATVVQPEALAVLQARFDNMTAADSMALCVSVLAAYQSYVTYDSSTWCALTGLELQGSAADWDQLHDRVLRLQTALGPEFASDFATELGKLGETTRRLAAIRRERMDDHRDWLQGIVSHTHGSGEDFMSGWILDFVWFDARDCRIHRRPHVHLDIDKMPHGVSAAPLSWEDNPATFWMYAGCWNLVVTEEGSLGTCAQWLISKNPPTPSTFVTPNMSSDDDDDDDNDDGGKESFESLF